MWKYIRLYHNSSSQKLKKLQSKFATKNLLPFPPWPILLNSTQTKLRANQVTSSGNSGHTLSCTTALCKVRMEPTLGIISEALGGWNGRAAVITVITKWPLSPAPPARQDRTKPGEQTLPCRGGRARRRLAPARRRLLAISGTLPKAELEQDTVASLFLADKRAKASYLHSLVKTPTKLACEMILKLLSGAGL